MDKNSELTFLPELPISQITTTYNLTGSWRTTPLPGFTLKQSPCKIACCLEQNIPEALKLIKIGRVKDAWKLWVKNNPFPAICGRTCGHFCKANCNRGDYDNPVDIGNIERFLGDEAIKNEWTYNFPNKNSQKFRIAIIGAGPAGLAATYFLRKKGIKIELFEKNEYLGGFMRLIPEYRLPRFVLDEEIKKILEEQERNKVEILKRVSLDEQFVNNVLKNNVYSGAIIATGAEKAISLNIQNKKSNKIINALDFLTSRRIQGNPSKIIVIGGGNTAIDAARVAKRLYHEAKIKIICRENQDKAPASKEEIKEALDEGIRIRYSAAPTEIQETNKRLKIRFREFVNVNDFQDNKLRFIPTDSFFSEETDCLITALGTEAEKHFRIEREQQNKVFYAGDVLGGPTSISQTIASAKAAVSELLYFLKTGKRRAQKQKNEAKVIKIGNINLAYFEKMPCFAPARKYGSPKKFKKCLNNNFSELNVTWHKIIAKKEANRCFGCGICIDCGNCEQYCPDMAVSIKKGKYEINKDYCKGCNICIEECPSGLLEQTKKED